MLLAHEREFGIRFDFVSRTRPDAVFPVPLPLPYCNRHPSRDWYGHVSGPGALSKNDFHYVLPRASAWTMNFTGFYAECDGTSFWHAHNEGLLFLAMQRAGFTMRPFNITRQQVYLVRKETCAIRCNRAINGPISVSPCLAELPFFFPPHGEPCF